MRRECKWCHELHSSAVAQWVAAADHPQIDGDEMWVCDECLYEVRDWVKSQELLLFNKLKKNLYNSGRPAQCMLGV